jgi:hypothetical protein
VAGVLVGDLGDPHPPLALPHLVVEAMLWWREVSGAASTALLRAADVRRK